MTSGHSGMIRPGDRIDVLCTYTTRRPHGGEFSRTKTVLEYIEVFAIDRNREGEGHETNKGTKAENLSVLVTPEQAHILMLASSKGKLQMALRNGEDKETVDVAPVDDKVFDELQTSKGADREEPDLKPVDDAKKPSDKELKMFLQAAAPAPSQPEAGVEVWAIEIFEGETKRVETIKRPTLKGGATAAPASEPAT